MLPFFVLVYLAAIIGGGICWLWSFKKKDFGRGARWMNERLGFVTIIDQFLK